MPDFLIRDHGSVVHFKAVSEAAQAYAEETFAVPSFLGVPTDFKAEHAPAQEILYMIEGEGFTYEGM